MRELHRNTLHYANVSSSDVSSDMAKAEQVRLVKKHQLATRWFHWLNFPLLSIMIWSGLLIYWANRAYHVGSFSLFPDARRERGGGLSAR